MLATSAVAIMYGPNTNIMIHWHLDSIESIHSSEYKYNHKNTFNHNRWDWQKWRTDGNNVKKKKIYWARQDRMTTLSYPNNSLYPNKKIIPPKYYKRSPVPRQIVKSKQCKSKAIRDKTLGFHNSFLYSKRSKSILSLKFLRSSREVDQASLFTM